MTPVTDSVDLLADLEARGLLQDSTDRDALAARLATGPITLYCGFDPTADSLHVGHLLGLLALRRFQDAGHHPLALVGGATGMIGDPSGRSDERNLLDAATLAANVAAITDQIGRVLGAESGWERIDNAAWTADLRLLEFLRDVGKHVTVNHMVAKESVKARMQGEHGISFTEFSYMLLQANDFWWLHANRGCELQVGGSDQWGNITAGIDLVRRRSSATVHGLTWPLLLRADGTKFGKSAAGESIWLAPERTSPYRFFQYWMQADDADVTRLLLQLTLVPVAEVHGLAAQHAEAPGKRLAQRRLATEVTALVHGAPAAADAELASGVLFGAPLGAVPEAVLAGLAGEVPTVEVPRSELERGIDVVDLLVTAGLASSRGEARRAVEQGGAYVNNERHAGDAAVDAGHLLFDQYLLVRRGRRDYALVHSRA
jgi:tyrosyl-tRNA synthetase